MMLWTMSNEILNTSGNGDPAAPRAPGPLSDYPHVKKASYIRLKFSMRPTLLVPLKSGSTFFMPFHYAVMDSNMVSPKHSLLQLTNPSSLSLFSQVNSHTYVTTYLLWFCNNFGGHPLDSLLICQWFSCLRMGGETTYSSGCKRFPFLF